MSEELTSIEAYINKDTSTNFYQRGFAKYSAAGVDQFAWHWSWWAMFGGVFYLLYRKLYMEALVFFVLFAVIGMIPFAGLAAWIASGGILPYLVYKRYKKVKAQVETNFSNLNEQHNALREVGGYNQWAIWLGVALHVLMWIGAFYMISVVGMATAGA
ncbi:MAG: DUF2628 domain-containing protein [Cocleimonas sp.]